MMESTTTNVERTLLGPGPSDVPPSVLQALARPTIGHLDPVFLTLMDDLRRQLQRLWCTDNELTVAMSGTGSAGMETLFVNLIEPGDRVLVCINGVFGGRMKDLAQRCGAQVTTLEIPWGRVFERDAIVDAARAHQARVVALVHAETSTGAGQPLEGLGERLRALDALLLVDCVTSLGGMPVRIDDWQIDAAYSGTQKCLSCPPGLAPVTLGPRAVERLQARKVPVQSWYLDLTMIKRYWSEERVYHHTAPINMLYALHEACRLVLAEGLEARFARHGRLHEELRSGLSELGLEYVSQPGHHLPMLNAVAIPNGVDDSAARRALLVDYGIEIGGGLGAFKGNAWRIGLMGYSARRRNVRLLLAALAELI